MLSPYQHQKHHNFMMITTILWWYSVAIHSYSHRNHQGLLMSYIHIYIYSPTKTPSIWWNSAWKWLKNAIPIKSSSFWWNSGWVLKDIPNHPAPIAAIQASLARTPFPAAAVAPRHCRGSAAVVPRSAPGGARLSLGHEEVGVEPIEMEI